MGKTWFNMSEISTHNHQEEGIERGCEEEKEGSPVSIFPPPKIQNFGNVSWLSGFLLSSFSSIGKTWFNRFETLTRSQREKEIERGCEEEKEGSPVTIFLPPSFEIVRLLTGRMSFCSEVLGMWVKRG